MQNDGECTVLASRSVEQFACSGVLCSACLLLFCKVGRRKIGRDAETAEPLDASALDTLGQQAGSGRLPLLPHSSLGRVLFRERPPFAARPLSHLALIEIVLAIPRSIAVTIPASIAVPVSIPISISVAVAVVSPASAR